MIDTKKYKKANGYIKLETNYSFFLSNILKDPALSNADKIKFFDHLLGYTGGSKNHFLKYCEDFFRKNQLLGPPLAKPDSLNPFIRIIVEENLFGRIRELIGIRYDKIRPLIMEMCISTDEDYRKAILENLLDNIILPINYTNIENCQKYLGLNRWQFKSTPKLRDAKIESFLQWSFPSPKKENVFESQDKINLLDCRSGLVDKPSTSKAIKIVFVHNIMKGLRPSTPTCFDAEFYPQFNPGGITKPLNNCKKQKGFSEFVHKANKFKNLSGEFYEVYKK